ncbi:F-box/WD repeat-containing protein 9-like [Ptychodera flava]|uniref:F-box/WD repeat-containing protein 9-like n=1 Tax=Ptychodera flava TaxID=63121 RepID=UPI00396A9C91
MKPPESVEISDQDGDVLDNSATSLASVASCSGYETADTNQDLGDSFDGRSNMEHLHILALPPEILHKISAYLDARFVLSTLSLVCKHFQELFAQDSTWKIRIGKRWPKQYPIIPVKDEKFNWAKACIDREEAYNQWSDYQNRMEHFSLTLGHFAAIDAVHLMQGGDICFSGSRDRTVSLWDLRKLDSWTPNQSTSKVKVKSLDTHTGWVWSMTSLDNILCTASWDCKVKLWDIEAGGVEVQSLKGKSANLCMAYNPDSLVVGSYDKKITVYDPRAGYTSIQSLKHHKKPVLCLVADENYIVSGSEDSTVVVYDRRAGEVFKTIQLEKFPMSMSYSNHDGQLWIGEKRGLLYLMDARQGNFDIVQTYDVGHTLKLTGVQHNLGCLATCSYDKTIKIHEPNADPGNICTLAVHDSEVADIHLMNNILASGSSDMTVHIWRPKTVVDSDETDEESTSQKEFVHAHIGGDVEAEGAIGGEDVMNLDEDVDIGAVGGKEVNNAEDGAISGKEVNNTEDSAICEKEVSYTEYGAVGKKEVNNTGDGAVGGKEVDNTGDGAIGEKEVDNTGDGAIGEKEVDNTGDGAIGGKEVNNTEDIVTGEQEVSNTEDGATGEQEVNNVGDSAGNTEVNNER